MASLDPAPSNSLGGGTFTNEQASSMAPGLLENVDDGFEGIFIGTYREYP